MYAFPLKDSPQAGWCPVHTCQEWGNEVFKSQAELSTLTFLLCLKRCLQVFLSSWPVLFLMSLWLHCVNKVFMHWHAKMKISETYCNFWRHWANLSVKTWFISSLTDIQCFSWVQNQISYLCEQSHFLSLFRAPLLVDQWALLSPMWHHHSSSGSCRTGWDNSPVVALPLILKGRQMTSSDHMPDI